MTVATQSHEKASAVQSGIDLVRAVYAAYARRDMASAATLFHPEGVAFQTPLLPWGGEHHGRAGLLAFMGGLTRHIETEIVDETLFEAGDRVVSIGRSRGRAVQTGVAFTLDAVHIYTLRDGMIVRYEAYVDTPGMLAALGGQA